jgi:hypothetical protein
MHIKDAFDQFSNRHFIRNSFFSFDTTGIQIHLGHFRKSENSLK